MRRDTCLNSDGCPCKRVGSRGAEGGGATQGNGVRKGQRREATAVGGSAGPTTVPLAAGASFRLTPLRAGSLASHRADDRPVLTVMHAHINSARVPACARDVQQDVNHRIGDRTTPSRDTRNRQLLTWRQTARRTGARRDPQQQTNGTCLHIPRYAYVRQTGQPRCVPGQASR